MKMSFTQSDHKKDVVYAWMVSGILHLIFISAAILITAVQIQNGNSVQVVRLVSDSETDSAVRHKAMTGKIITDSKGFAEKPAIKPEVSLPLPAILTEHAQKPSGQSAPVMKRELVAAAQSAVNSPKGPVDTKFGNAAGPNFLHREMPVYPDAARSMNREGRVLLRLTIDEIGRLTNLEVIEGAPFGFTEAAIEAARKSTYVPAKREGIAVASRTKLPIRFVLER
jgi:TonB family protein